MNLTLGNRLDYVLQSEIRNMSIECDRIGGINLSQGICDMEIPAVIRSGAQNAIDQKYNSYTRYDGLEELRAAIARKVELFNGLQYDPEGEITVSAGATGALYCACQALLNPEDEVLLFEPFYGYHVNTLRATGLVPAYVPLSQSDWGIDMDALEQAVNGKTRGIIISSPANPNGKVFSVDELEILADFAKVHDLFVFTDEIYEHFVYDGGKHVAPAAIPGMRERTITISGLSKTFSITGWRIGYSMCDAAWAKAIGYYNDLIYVCAPAPLQMGVAAGLDQLDQNYYAGLSAAYQKKRDIICTALADSGLTPYVPAGAYYVLVDISSLPGAGSKERAMHLLHKTGVACVPGEAFYHDDSGEDLARFCFAKDDDVLAEACQRLRSQLH